MNILFAMIMCLVWAPAFAIVYTLDASNAIQSGNLTDGNAHWSGFATTTTFVCPECHVSGNPSPFVETPLTFDITPLGQTRIVDNVGGASSQRGSRDGLQHRAWNRWSDTG